MNLDFDRFRKACDPSHSLKLSNAEDRQYYIDFAKVRGGPIINQLKRTITPLYPNQPRVD